MTADIGAVARTAWKVAVVLLLTIIIMWAIGWVIQVTTGGVDDGAATTTEER